MKKQKTIPILILLSVLILQSCSANRKVHVYESSGLETEMKVHAKNFKDTPVFIHCDNEDEAIWIQHRLARHCNKPYRNGKMLELYKCHLEAKNALGGNIVGDKFRCQIDQQLKVFLPERPTGTWPNDVNNYTLCPDSPETDDEPWYPSPQGNDYANHLLPDPPDTGEDKPLYPPNPNADEYAYCPDPPGGDDEQDVPLEPAQDRL